MLVDISNNYYHFLVGTVNRRMIRNPEADSPPTIFVGPPDEYDNTKFVPAEVPKGFKEQNTFSISPCRYEAILLKLYSFVQQRESFCLLLIAVCWCL